MHTAGNLSSREMVFCTTLILEINVRLCAKHMHWNWCTVNSEIYKTHVHVINIHIRKFEIFRHACIQMWSNIRKQNLQVSYNPYLAYLHNYRPYNY